MCLYKSKKIEQKGEITCYKLVAKISYLSEPEREYTSPFNYKGWKIGETETAEFEAGIDKENIIGSNGSINSGAFHTLKSPTDAVVYAAYNVHWFPRDDVYVATCVIPEDNEYLYEGEVINNPYVKIEGYASEKLKIVSVEPLSKYPRPSFLNDKF